MNRSDSPETEIEVVMVYNDDKTTTFPWYPTQAHLADNSQRVLAKRHEDPFLLSTVHGEFESERN